MKWQLTLRIFRYKQDESPPHLDSFQVEVRPDEFVLDAIERVWAEQDRSLVFRHACHHAICGACGMRINGRERLTCTTRIDSVTDDRGTLVVEPLHHLPVISDLLVDMTPFYARMEQVGFASTRTAEPLTNVQSQELAYDPALPVRFESCLECALCLSACPIPGTDPAYLGPAALAAIERTLAEPPSQDVVPFLLGLADGEHGIWRCHHAFECTDVCPAAVDPGRAIMALRGQLLRSKMQGLFTTGG